MNWKSIILYSPKETYHEILLRVDYNNGRPVYIVGYVFMGDIRWYNDMTGDSGHICYLQDIGKSDIAAVYYIDPREILK